VYRDLADLAMQEMFSNGCAPPTVAPMATRPLASCARCTRAAAAPAACPPQGSKCRSPRARPKLKKGVTRPGVEDLALHRAAVEILSSEMKVDLQAFVDYDQQLLKDQTQATKIQEAMKMNIVLIILLNS
jgi:hypothetical protein